MGDFPMMTDKGTFIINGTERVVVSQLVRSPGVYFDRNVDKTSDKDVFACKVIPARGAWLEFETDKRDTVGVRVDRKRRQYVTVFLKALGFGGDRGDPRSLRRRRVDRSDAREGPDRDPGRSSHGRLPQAAAGRASHRRERAGTFSTTCSSTASATTWLRSAATRSTRSLGSSTTRRRSRRWGPFSVKEDILETIRYLVRLHAGNPDYETDDIDHFGNRRVRPVGELLQNQIRVGLSRMERVVKERMTTQDVEAITPQTLINIRPVVASIKEFFGSSQLSQFMDQTNPLAGLTHRRRLSALGPGGLSRERAGFEVQGRAPQSLRPHVSDRDAGGSEHRPDGLALDLRAAQPVRLHRDALPAGRQWQGLQQGRLPDRRRRGLGGHRPGERRPRRERQVRRGQGPRPRAAQRARLRRSVRGRVHGRLAEADRLGVRRLHPLPRARRREPGPHGRQHAASGRALDASDRPRSSGPASSSGPRSMRAT